MSSKYIKKYLKLTIKHCWKKILKMILHVLKDEMPPTFCSSKRQAFHFFKMYADFSHFVNISINTLLKKKSGSSSCDGNPLLLHLHNLCFWTMYVCDNVSEKKNIFFQKD